MTSESAGASHPGTAPGMAALAEVVARQRAEMDRLREQIATSAVLERAKGALMALTGCTPAAAGEDLLQRAKAGGRTLLEECRLTLGSPVRLPASVLKGERRDGVCVVDIRVPSGPE